MQSLYVAHLHVVHGCNRTFMLHIEKWHGEGGLVWVSQTRIKSYTICLVFIHTLGDGCFYPQAICVEIVIVDGWLNMIVCQCGTTEFGFLKNPERVLHQFRGKY